MAKRLFDIVVSGIALFVLSPLLLIIALSVKLDSRGAVLFRQRRLGRGGRYFQIYKFRTMISNPSGQGLCITMNRDARITRVGRVLRRFDLDELPTLYNVLKGDMSIVGPRPEVPAYLPFYSEEQKQVFSVKPGLTDPGTLAFRQEATRLVGENPEAVYTQEILPQKLAVSLAYVRTQSFVCDLKIVARTLLALVSRPKG